MFSGLQILILSCVGLQIRRNGLITRFVIKKFLVIDTNGAKIVSSRAITCLTIIEIHNPMTSIFIADNQ